ncbi:JAB domain-containing protein [Roseobacter sp. HKCCA0882]|uniref:JAB domain-containing protein n=1 Tax=Roseobacter sp. HKCCA0882 TaxID=3120337 RepID=UPI0030EE59F6
MTKPELTLAHSRTVPLPKLRRVAVDAAQHDLLARLLAAAAPNAPSARMAATLLRQHGSLARVLCASDQRLKSVSHMTEDTIAHLRLTQAVAETITRKQLDDRPILGSWQTVMDYCRATMAHRDVGEVRVFYLNRKNHLIADEQHSRGTVDHAPFYPREVIKRALEMSASALVVVHNHPSGDPTPSTGDIALTRQLGEASKMMGLTPHDHIIITPSGEVSFRAEGLI